MAARSKEPTNEQKVSTILLQLSYLKEGISELKKEVRQDLKELKDKLEGDYVSQIEFKQVRDTQKGILENMVYKKDFSIVQKLAFGMVTIVLTAVMTGLMALVIKG